MFVLNHGMKYATVRRYLLVAGVRYRDICRQFDEAQSNLQEE